MKRRYERPSAYIEEFTPNEYVAACGDHGKVYKFECNAGEKNKQYNVYYFNNGQKKYLTKGGLFGSYYHPCKATHEAEEDTGFISGFIDDQSTWQDEKIPFPSIQILSSSYIAHSATSFFMIILY